jgi:hypothetical protein
MEIGKILLLTYIIIASNYCSNLFSNSLKNAIENNRYVQCYNNDTNNIYMVYFNN